MQTALAGDTMHGRAVRTLGDVRADLRSIASAASVNSSNGGVGDFLSDSLATFRRLPGELATLQNQADAVARVLTTSKVVGIGMDGITEARGLIRDAVTQYPSVKVRVDQLTRALAPIMPDLYNGTVGLDAIGTLAANGLDLIGTVYAMNDLAGKRTQADILIQQAATNPALPPDVRDEAIQSLAGENIATLLKYAAVGALAFLVVKSVMK